MEVTEISLKRVMSAARRHCRRTRFYDQADDFAQYIALKIIEGRRPKVFQAWHNFISQERGQKNPKNGHDSYKTIALRQTVSLDLKHESIGSWDPDGHVDLKNMVMRHMKLLPVSRDHEFYWLHFFYGYTNDEISRKLGITVAAVKNALYRIAIKLREDSVLASDPARNDRDHPSASTCLPKT